MPDRIPIKLTVNGEDRLDFIWHNPNGTDFHYQVNQKWLSEPSKEVRDALGEVVRAIWAGKPYGPLLKELATRGKDLRNTIYRGHDGAGARAGQTVRDKFLPGLGAVTLNILVSEFVHIPWGLLYDGDPARLTGEETALNDYREFWCIKYRVARRLMGISDSPIDDPRKTEEARLLSVTNSDLWNAALKRLPDLEKPVVEQLLTLSGHKQVFSSREFFQHWADNHQHLDVLYVYCHADATTLLIAQEDEVSVGRFYRNLVHDPLQTRPACLVFLNGCRTAVGNDENGFLEVTGQPGFCGFIGTETVVPDVFAMRFGADFLNRLFREGKTVGEIMTTLREDHWPLSLVYATSCNPALRLMPGNGDVPVVLPKVELDKYDLANAQLMGGGASETEPGVANKLRWPDDPYKGLTSYRDSDRMLFAARQVDVDLFVAQMTRATIRVMLLHGETGCGKTSFLNAGVMPELEERIGSFHVVRDVNDVYERYALLVRSTDDPLGMLAYEVFRMVRPIPEILKRRNHEYRSSIVDGYKSDFDFRQAVDRDPELLVSVLAEISEADMRSIVIGVDQAEEMFSLKPGKDGDAARRAFFHFLVYCTRADTGVKLMIAFRTEFHGRFYSALRQARGGMADVQRVGDFYLRQLGADDLVEVIEEPTSDKEKFKGYGSPRQRYKFRYEDGVARAIVQQLAGEASPLPALQIVCRRLYRRAQAESEDLGMAVVRMRDFRLRGVVGQIDGHLQQALDETLGSLSVTSSARWRDVLCTLARYQPGGSVTTEVIEAEKLHETARTFDVRKDFVKVMNALSREPWQIVKTVNVQNRESHGMIACYSLGHDVIGYALKRWEGVRRIHRKAIWILRGLNVVMAVLLLYAGSLVNGSSRTWIFSFALLLAVFGFVPNKRYTRWLYTGTYGLYLDILGFIEILRIRFDGRLVLPGLAHRSS